MSGSDPCTGGSKGLLRKNIRILGGNPLIKYTIEAALKSRCMDGVVVSTDNNEIASIAKLAGADVPFLRPEELATDQAASIDVLQHAVHFYELKLNLHFQYIMLLQPTSPLRNDYDIREAYNLFITQKADSLQSVTLADTHPYLLREWNQGIIQPYLKDQVENLRRQELPDLYMLNGAIYIIKRDLLMIENLMIGPKNIGYVMPKERSVDIDDEMDLKWAEFLMQNRV